MREYAGFLALILLITSFSSADATTTVPSTTTFLGTTTMPSTTTVTATTTLTATTTILLMTSTLPSTTTQPGGGSTTLPSSTTVPTSTTTVPVTTLLEKKDCNELQVEVDGDCVNEEVIITVLDRKDEPVEDAHITVYFMGTGNTLPANSTDEDGISVFTPEEVGEYKVLIGKSRYCNENVRFKVASCAAKASKASSETSTTTTITASTSTSTTPSTSTSLQTTTLTTPATTTSTLIETTTLTPTIIKDEARETSSPGFVGRVMLMVGGASIVAALLLLASLLAYNVAKKTKPKETALWKKEGSSRLEKV